MKKIISFLLLILLFAGCNGSLVTSQPSEKEKAVELKNLYDRFSTDSNTRTLKDFRLTSNLNPDILVVDSVFNATLNEGGTTVYYKRQKIWKNSWNRPYMSQNRMRTRLEHGYCVNGSIYFLYIINESIYPSGGVGTEFRLFRIEKNQLFDMSSSQVPPSLLKWPVWGVQEVNSEIIIKNGGGWVRHPEPIYFSLFKDGAIQSYCYDCP